MEHTSTICNMIDKPKHLKSAFIHKIEEPPKMKMPIWNTQQMAKKIDNRATTKCSWQYKISLQRLDKIWRPMPSAKPLKLEDATPCCSAEAPQYFSPVVKGVQSSQEICQLIDRATVRTTQVSKSPNPLSNPVDLKSSTEWCAPLDDWTPR